ncbi:hypothetical protein BH11VER1_BH11VER1_24900 [soil metagenome]
MSKTSAILTHPADHAYMVMQTVLGGLASITLGGLAWAIWHGVENGPLTAPAVKQQAPNIVSTSVLPPAIKAVPKEKPALTPVAATNKAPEPLPVIPPLATYAPSPLPPAPMASLGVPPAPVLPPPPTASAGKLLKNPQILEALEAGKLARKQGDMQASLEALRNADAKEPNHPLILSEMALTYEEMGIMTKATAAWRNIVAMGEQTAGSVFTLAKSKLEGRDNGMPNSVSAVKLGECQVIRDASSKKGERIAVRVPLVATPGAVIDPGQMDIHVYLFEDVNQGERIEQARATAPSNEWVSAPVDWKDSNEELVDVIYDLPTPKPEEIREFGRRKFYGYVVKLFYQNKLVGEEAKPASLRDFSPARSGPAGLDSALFPKQ